MDGTMINTATIIDVYTDGSGNTMESDGAWAYRLLINGKVVEEDAGYMPTATNNTAEVSAGIEGLKAVDRYIKANNIGENIVTLISDSQLTLCWATGKYKCKKDHLKPYVRDLQVLTKSLGASTKWVKGHAGNEHNERCDELAKAARYGTQEKESNTTLDITLQEQQQIIQALLFCTQPQLTDEERAELVAKISGVTPNDI